MSTVDRRKFLYQAPLLVAGGALLAKKSSPKDDLEARVTALEASVPTVQEASSSGTLQERYDALPDSGGAVNLSPYERYDVGDGLNLDRTKRVAFTSPGRGSRSRNHPNMNSAPVIFSSTGADTLVNFDAPNSLVNAYGFEFSNIDFEISPTTTTVFRAPAVCSMRIINNGFYHPFSNTTEAPFLVVDANNNGPEGDDSSWFRISDNYVRGGTLVKAIGYNVNQWVIRENIVFSKNATDPMIYLWGAHRCVIRDNNLEGPTTGIHLESSWACRLDGNAGEQTDPFILLDRSYGNLITDMGISYPGSRVFVRLVNNSADNMIMSSVGTGMRDLYNHTNWIIDETSKQNNWAIAPSSFSKPEWLKLSGPIEGTQ